MSGPDRELRPSLAAAGAGVLVLLTWTVWRNSSSRLSLFVCAATIAAGLVDVVWSLVASRRVHLEVHANTDEATVGDTVTFSLSVTGPHQFIHLSVPTFQSAKVGVDVPALGPVSGVARTREMVTEVEAEIVSHGLAGLVACARRRSVRLARTLWVGPRPVPAAEPVPELFRTWGEGDARPAPTGDLVRGVRPYVPGDPMRRVHWRATARVGDLGGDLIVKEVEDTGAPRLVIALDLGGGGLAGERAAGRAAWYALEGLRRGYAVVLATVERGQPLTGPATSPSDVTRRLAAASAPGRPEVPSDGQVGGVLVVTDRGDSWR